MGTGQSVGNVRKRLKIKGYNVKRVINGFMSNAQA